jgi:hypothetical protein
MTKTIQYKYATVNPEGLIMDFRYNKQMFVKEETAAEALRQLIEGYERAEARSRERGDVDDAEFCFRYLAEISQWRVAKIKITFEVVG